MLIHKLKFRKVHRITMRFKSRLKNRNRRSTLNVRWQLIHSHGAATAKALSPLNLSRDRGTYKRALLADLRGLEVDLNEIRSEM